MRLVRCGMMMLTTWTFMAGLARAGDQPFPSRITALGLFKNGFCLVTRTVEVPGAGTYAVDLAPDSVHGTFWVESDAVASVRFTRRSFEIATPPAGTDLAADLAGRDVVLHFRSPEMAAIEGKVVGASRGETAPNWDRSYESPEYLSWWGRPPIQAQPTQSRFLVLETSLGYVHVDPAMIGYVETRGGMNKGLRTQPVMAIAVQGTGPATVEISYLTKGIAWSPSYRIDLTDPRRLTLEQKSVIKNELESFDGAEVYLISGFPSIELSHVTSPLSLRTTWAQFFQQLATRPGSALGQSHVVTQQVALNALSPNAPVDLAAMPTGDGPDIHYQGIGRLALENGDALYLSVAKAAADYERIVEWIVPDTRDESGRRISANERQQDPDRYLDVAWDAVEFRNPLRFPMTTAPAMLIDAGRFLGQRTSYWTDPGELARLRITRSLSVRTRSVEQEEQGSREMISIAGADFTRVTVSAKLSVSNHRNEIVPLVVARRFSGDLLEADGAPRKSLRAEGAYSVNPRNELEWRLSLGPGEQRDIAYRYTVLVPR